MSFTRKVREAKPLVLNITNFVSADLVANGLLAVGASPVMSLAAEELAELVPIAGSVVINIGTLNRDFMELARTAASLATVHGKPLLLDPVGAGATKLRTNFARELLESFPFTLVRGNAGEISALATAVSSLGSTRGVDSALSSFAASDAALDVCARYNTHVVISGATDFVVAPGSVTQIPGGHEMMARVTGMGCLLTAVLGAQAAVVDPLQAARNACELFARAGEEAFKISEGRGLGTFRLAFLDALSRAH